LKNDAHLSANLAVNFDLQLYFLMHNYFGKDWKDYSQSNEIEIGPIRRKNNFRAWKQEFWRLWKKF
jgi:hypothetical protein